MRRVLKGRRGFAIVLVASLAGLVFLLGASLVAVARLQTAAGNYDQRVRLAREHARSALDMAVAELQEKLGQDTAVTYIADVYRNDRDDDFKAPSVPANVNVEQPFWLGTKDGANEYWLVTQPIASDFATGDGSSKLADPIAADFPDAVTLVGDGTVGGGNALLEVAVPKEKIEVDGVVGYTDSRSIGHFAYWVGDLGVKASYARYDETQSVSHDEYSDDLRQERLTQTRLQQPKLHTVDTLEGSNPSRIDSFANDFQFRDRIGSSSGGITGGEEYFLENLSKSEAESSFQDFTPLSRGLLTNSATGVLKVDLSSSSTSGVSNYDAYANLAKGTLSTASTYWDDTYEMRAADSDGPAIHPVLTQINLSYYMYLEIVDTNLYLRLAFTAGVELWNPFTSALEAEAIRIEVKGLPNLKVLVTPEWSEELGSLSAVPNFVIPETVWDETEWRPGQIASFSGPESSNTGSSPFLLSPSSAYLPDTSSRVEINDLAHVVTGGWFTGMDYEFENDDGSDDPAKIVVDMYLDDSNEKLVSYVLPASYEYMTDGNSESTPLGSSSPTFGFSWEISNGQLPLNQDYNPLEGNLLGSTIPSFEEDPAEAANLPSAFSEASVDHFLGENPTNGDGTPNTSFDLPIIELPKQELISPAHLANSYGAGPLSVRIGEPNDANNDLFDTTFFSTVPQLGGNWTTSDPLPNSALSPVYGASVSDLRAADPAEHLLIDGAFNIHSTSIDSWAALLKGSPASRNAYWNAYFSSLEDDGNGVLDTELYLFFNHVQSAENTYDHEASPTESGDQFRESFRHGMFALEEADLDVLAVHIVSNIRKRIQGVAPYNTGSNEGPFVSMEDFVDSGVLKNAIADAEATVGQTGGLSAAFTQSWVTAGTAGEFRQSTILNMLAPVLSNRSDTFLVRAYGDAVDPSDPSKIWARAYCEAVVQRTYVPKSDSSLGRSLEVVAFRWLSPSDI